MDEIKKNLYLKSNKKILFLNTGPGFGDFIHKCLFICSNIKFKNPSVTIYFNQINHIRENKDNIFYYFDDILSYIKLSNINNNKYDLVINEIELSKLESSEYVCFKEIITNIKTKNLINLNYTSFYFNSNIYCGLRYLTDDFRELFNNYIRNKVNLNDKHKETIVFHIGSFSRKNKDYKDTILQSHIVRLIQKYKNKKFTLIGRTSDLTNIKLIELLKTSKENIINIIDKTENINLLIEILYNCKCFIGRFSGIMHLAGCCNNLRIIYTAKYAKGPEIILNLFRSNISSDENLFYKEKWAPLSANSTRLLESMNHEEIYQYLDDTINTI